MQPTRVARTGHPESSAQLWRMTVRHRVIAIRCGELSQDQLLEWAKRRPHELRLIKASSSPAELTPEVAEIDQQQDGC